MQSGYYYMFTDSRNAMEMLNGDMLMELELRRYLIFVTALNWVYICVCTLTHIIKWASVQLHRAITSYDVIGYFFLFFLPKVSTYCTYQTCLDIASIERASTDRKTSQQQSKQYWATLAKLLNCKEKFCRSKFNSKW